MKLNKTYYPSHKFNKLTPNFFLCNNISMKYLSKNLGDSDKSKMIKIERNITDKANFFTFTPYVLNAYAINRLKAMTKKINSRFIKILPYKNLKVYRAHLKLVDAFSKQSYDKMIKYNLIFKNRCFYSQKKLWLCTYGLNSLFYETFVEINRKRRRSINHKKERLYTETSNKKYRVLEDFGIPNSICLWIFMLRSQILSEIFKCSVYGYNQNTFKIQKLLLKNWSMQILIFCLLSDSFCFEIKDFEKILGAIPIDFLILSKKKNRQASQINYALYQKSKSEVTNSNSNMKISFQKMHFYSKNRFFGTKEQNDYALYKLKQLLYKYFLYVLFQPEWETKNNSYCYNFRPGTTIYDCLDSIIQFYRAPNQTKHEFIFNTKISFLSNIFHSFRFIESHRESVQKKTNFINKIIRSSISIKQHVSNRNLNHTWLYITLLSFLNKKYHTLHKNQQFYISLPSAFSCGSLLLPVTQKKNRISGSQPAMQSLKIGLKIEDFQQHIPSSTQQSKCSKTFKNRIENQKYYKSNLQNRLILKKKLDDSSSIHNKIINNKIMLENLENQIVDFILKHMYKEKIKTEGRNQNQLQSLSQFSSKPFSFLKKNSSNYKFHVKKLFQKITFVSYPLGIYSKKSYSILLHRAPSLNIHSEACFNILQAKNIIKKSAFYNELDIVFEVMSQKQKRAPYNQILLHMTSPCLKLSYFFNYLLIQYGAEIIFISSNKLTINQCIEFFNQDFLNTSSSDPGIKNQKQKIILNKNDFSHSNDQSQTKINKNLSGHHELNLEGFSILRAVRSKQGEENFFRKNEIFENFAVSKSKILKKQKNTHNIKKDISLFFTHKKKRNSLVIESRRNSIRSHTGIQHKVNFIQHIAKKTDVPIFLVPSNSNINNYLQQIKQLIKNSKTDAQDFLIDKLAYKINLWCYSYRIVSNKKIFYYCDHMILRWLWRWSCRRHPNKNKNWILNKYFHSITKKNKKQINQSRWNFCIYKNSTKSFYCLPRHSQIKLVRHLKIPEHYSIYDENWKYWLRRLS